MLNLINLRKVSERVSLGKTTIYSLIKENKFPKPVGISARRVGWRESDIDAFIASRQDSPHYLEK